MGEKTSNSRTEVIHVEQSMRSLLTRCKTEKAKCEGEYDG
jgi:hypothetical protein